MGQKLRMNSSMAEQSPVKRQDESSNLSSSAIPATLCRARKVEVSATRLESGGVQKVRDVKPLPLG